MNGETDNNGAATPEELERWAADADRVRNGVGLFRLRDRGLVQISGTDRVRWLDGMMTNDVTQLIPGPERSGCYALLLTHQGRIVSDATVSVREDAFWLEMSAQAVPGVIERFDKHIIADDVKIEDLGTATEWLGVEGPNSTELIAALAEREIDIERDSWTEVRVGASQVTVGKWGTSAEVGYRLLVPTGQGESVASALRAVGASRGLVEAGPETLEILRIEAGTPRYGAELDETVLPAEARLERAISQTKGCYIGQEVVARMASRGRTSHLLVGLRCEIGVEVGARLTRPIGLDGTDFGKDSGQGEKKIGEVTSVCLSASAGPIALAFVRTAHATTGITVQVGARPAGAVTAVISELPFEPVNGS